MSKLVKNYFYNIIYQFFVLLIPIVLSPYLGRTLGAENIGVYSYIYSVSMLVSTIVLLGTYNYGCREIAYIRDDKYGRNKLFYQIFGLRLILGIVGILAYIAILYFSDYSSHFIIYIPWMIATFIDPSWLFVAMEDMKLTVLKNFFIKLISVILIFILVKDENDLNKYIIIMACSTFIANFALCFQIKKYVNKPVFSLYKCKEHISGSLDLFWPQMATMLYLQIDKVMINLITKQPNQVSFYDYGEKIVTIPLTFITVLSTVMMPRIANQFAKGDQKKIRENLVFAGRFSLMIAVPMAFGIALVASDLVPWYLGEAFNPTIKAIIFISPIIITNSLAGISGNQYFTATNQMSILLKSYMTAAIINILMNSILIPIYGFIGATIATVSSSIISVSIQYWYMNKQVEIKSLGVSLIKYLLLSIPMIIIVACMSSYLPSKPSTTILTCVSGGLIYLLTLVLSKDEIIFMVKNRVFKFSTKS